MSAKADAAMHLSSKDDVKISAIDTVEVAAKKKLLLKGDAAAKISGGGKDISMRGGKVDVG